MQNGVGAIRAARSRTRFVLPPVHRRERHLGLHRVFRTPSPSSPTSLIEARLQPVRALRRAARGLVPASGLEQRPTSAAIGADPRMRWTRSRNGLSGSRIAGSSPWRG
jgi:hypothetical protein